ncbi:MAG TPA: IPT/TIG domain-containing protein [Verrucomicrobiae bacterium]|nr:IPT/TIG domain-containing protein [Verrucomicrobiae bacterium]
MVLRLRAAILGLVSLSVSPLVTPLSAQSYTISTVAGGGLPSNIAALRAAIGPVSSLATDTAGNLYLISGNQVVRMDSAAGTLTVAAGTGAPGFSGDHGPAVQAQLNQPSAIAIDLSGNIYVADHYRIREISSGIIFTIAGDGTAGSTGDNGPAIAARVNPVSMATDAAGNLYFTNTVSNNDILNTPGGPIFVKSSSVREISGGVVTTIAGNGTCCGPTSDNVPATGVPMYELTGIAVDSAGNIYVGSQADLDNTAAVRRISQGIVTTVSPGSGGVAFSGPNGIALDAAGAVYFSDSSHIWKIVNGGLTLAAGTGGYGFGGDGGPAAGATLNQPYGIAFDSAGALYIADEQNARVRQISNGVITTVAGNGTQSFGGDGGPATAASLFMPIGIALDRSGNLYIADQDNSRVREVSNGIITTVAGNGSETDAGDGGPATAAGLFNPEGVAVDSAGNLYIADSINNVVRKVSGGVITTVGGPLNFPRAVAVDPNGNVYASGFLNEQVFELVNGNWVAVAGNGTRGYSGDNGPATSAQLNQPWGMAFDSAGNLYIGDSGNAAIRRVSHGAITTVAGTGTFGTSADGVAAASAQLNSAAYIAIDTSGNLFISDANRIRKVSNGILTTVAGLSAPGYSGENVPAAAAQVAPGALAIDAAGNVDFAEVGAERVRRMTPCASSCPLPPAPVITSVLNGASLQPGIAAGSWVTIQGTNLGNTTRAWLPAEIVDGQLPASLDGVSVTIDGSPAFIEYVSPTQINLQAPSDRNSGAVSVVVTDNGESSAPATAQLQPFAPALFEHYGTGYADASRYPDYASIGNPSAVPGAVAAKPGDIVILWATGLGPTNPPTPAGMQASAASPLSSAVTATVGGAPVSVVSAALTGGASGLYQVAIQLPSSLPAGTLAVQISVGGVLSQAGVSLYVAAP